MHRNFNPNNPPQSEIHFEQFLDIDIRIGTVLAVDLFPEARKPAYKLQIDFGSGVGKRKSSAQITEHYKPDDLVGRQVVAVVNFPPRQIGPFISEVLVLGFTDAGGGIVLIGSDRNIPNGARML